MDTERFYKAQRYSYSIALEEIQRGRKRTHWMWYIFPQLSCLARSPMAQYYGIASLKDAQLYMEDQILREHLLEISSALLELDTSDPHEIFGSPDDLKLQSSMTLFGEAAPGQEVFQQVLDKFYGGQKDERTLRFIERERRS